MTHPPSPNPPGTLNELFLGAIARYRERPVAMRWKPAGAGWTPISFQQLLERVRSTSLALANLGVKRGDRIAILSENRPEWAIVDYAALALGAADVPVYPTLPAPQMEYILRDAGASVAFASTQQMLDKLLEVRSALPGLRHIVAFDATARGPDVLAFSELEAQGRALPAEGWEAAALMARPDDLATIIYTSGTTGNPKGVMLTHGNITSNVISGLLRIPIQEDPGQQECLSFLPLSHIFERMAGHYLMTHAGAIINYAGSIDTVSADMGEIRPTLMCSVPRLYEKIYARVQENAMAGSAAKRQIFRWAKKVGRDLRGPHACGQAGAAGARRAARRGRPAGLPEAARPHRQPAPLLRVGRRPAQCRYRAILPRGEAPDPRGIRPHRDVARHRRQHLPGPPARHRGQAAPRHRGEDRAPTARS